MTPEQQKEEISKAYVQAVAARCGFAVGSWSQDHGGMDTIIGAASMLGAGILEKPKVDLQIKCTSRKDMVHAEFVSCQLARTHYDHLRARASIPHLLVVLVLPEDETIWVEHSVERLILRRCAYWVKMTGMGPADGESKTVRVPTSQVFSPTQLTHILTMISEGRSDEL